MSRARPSLWWLAAALALLLVVAAAAGFGIAQRRADRTRAAALTGGDSERGRHLVASYGCGACHTIPGIHGASGMVGPPLAAIANRLYIGGVLLNRPDNMIRWIQNAPGIDPLTAMPATGAPPADARDMAAYLYTLR